MLIIIPTVCNSDKGQKSTKNYYDDILNNVYRNYVHVITRVYMSKDDTSVDTASTTQDPKRTEV